MPSTPIINGRATSRTAAVWAAFISRALVFSCIVSLQRLVDELTIQNVAAMCKKFLIIFNLLRSFARLHLI